MKFKLWILGFLLFASCNRGVLVKNENIAKVYTGTILIIDNSIYFVNQQMDSDKELQSYIFKQNKSLYNLPHMLACQFEEVFDRRYFKKFRINIIPQGSPMVGGEILYRNVKIMLLQIDSKFDYGQRIIKLQDYGDLAKEYTLRYDIESRTLIYAIPINSK